MSGVLMAAYLAVAAGVAIYAFRYGALERPRDRLLSGSHYLLLAATATVVGAVWVIFLPVLTFAWLRSSRSQGTAAVRTWPVIAREKSPAHF
jgi:amino acid transporter